MKCKRCRGSGWLSDPAVRWYVQCAFCDGTGEELPPFPAYGNPKWLYGWNAALRTLAAPLKALERAQMILGLCTLWDMEPIGATAPENGTVVLRFGGVSQFAEVTCYGNGRVDAWCGNDSMKSYYCMIQDEPKDTLSRIAVELQYAKKGSK